MTGLWDPKPHHRRIGMLREPAGREPDYTGREGHIDIMILHIIDMDLP